MRKDLKDCTGYLNSVPSHNRCYYYCKYIKHNYEAFCLKYQITNPSNFYVTNNYYSKSYLEHKIRYLFVESYE